MPALRFKPVIGFGVAALLFMMPCGWASAETGKVDNIEEAFARFHSCWRAPTAPDVHKGIEVTVIATFRRDGSIMGQPKVTHEPDEADEHDRFEFRKAIMEALQRCAPMPFTEGMAGAVAGRPFAIRFRN